MEVFVEHLGAVKFQVNARSHTVISDQPSDIGGSDQGMNPPELLLAALGACAGYYAVQYLKKRNLSMEKTRVRVAAEKVKNPFRLDNFQVEIEIPADLLEEHRAGIEQAVHHCLIHKTLLYPPQITLVVKSAAPVTN